MAPSPPESPARTGGAASSRSLLGMGLLAPAAYAVLVLALAQIQEHTPDWSAEAPKLVMLLLCCFHLYKTGRDALVRAESGEQALIEAKRLTGQLVPENQRLQAELEAATHSSRAKSLFLARMGHHLRTPMNGILATTELALGSELSAEQQDLLGMARDSGRALLRAVDHVLDAARIEGGELALDEQPTDPRNVVAAVLSNHASTAASQQAELACRVGAGVPFAVLTDPQRLEQVVDHLLVHALSEAGRGAVVVSVDADDEHLRITVSDTGPGMSEADAERLLAPWCSGDDDGDTGLGPSVAHQLVGLMGGSLQFQSQVGVGSRFVVELPLRVAPAQPGQAVPPDLAGLRVLVAEGRMTTRAILAECLRARGARVDSVENGREAIDALEEARAAGRPHAVVLLDAQLPQRSDYEHDRSQGEVVTVMLGAVHSSDCEAAGRLHVPRPVLPQALFGALTSARDGVTATVCASEPGRGGPLRVLVVEDNPVGQKVAQRVLSSWGHTVWLAGNGKAALDMLKRQSVDLVLMDLAMPVMDGLAATRALREDELQNGLPRLPIIAMTAHADRGDRERCLAAGMDGHVAKPIRAEELAAVMAELRHSALAH